MAGLKALLDLHGNLLTQLLHVRCTDSQYHIIRSDPDEVLAEFWCLPPCP